VVNELNSFIASAAGKPLPWARAKIFKSKIRRNIKLAESPGFGQTILKYDPTSNGAADYRALAAEIAAMDPAVANPPVLTLNPAIDTTRLLAARVEPLDEKTQAQPRSQQGSV
jgi:hypothetical protein